MFVDRCIEFHMLSLRWMRLADVALEKPEPPALPLPAQTEAEGCVEVRDVSFRYASTDRPLLSNISLRVEAGECVAITAPSGTGKSTLLNLIARPLQPQRGGVSIGR